MNKFVVLPWGRFKAMEKSSSIIQAEEVPIPDGDNYTQKQQSSTKPQLVKQAGSGGETLGDNQQSATIAKSDKNPRPLKRKRTKPDRVAKGLPPPPAPPTIMFDGLYKKSQSKELKTFKNTKWLKF